MEAGLDIGRVEAGDNWAEVSPSGLGVGSIHGVKEPRSAADSVLLVQLVGYAFRDYGSRFDRLIVPILREEGVEPSSFYLKEAEEISNEGGFRQAPLLAKDCEYAAAGSQASAELHPRKGGVCDHAAPRSAQTGGPISRRILKARVKRFIGLGIAQKNRPKVVNREGRVRHHDCRGRPYWTVRNVLRRAAADEDEAHRRAGGARGPGRGPLPRKIRIRRGRLSQDNRQGTGQGNGRAGPSVEPDGGPGRENRLGQDDGRRGNRAWSQPRATSTTRGRSS